MIDQLALFPDDRLDPPDCYDEVVSCLEAARENDFEGVDEWEAEILAIDLSDYAGFNGDDYRREDLERCIRIWRERQAKDLDIQNRIDKELTR